MTGASYSSVLLARSTELYFLSHVLDPITNYILYYILLHQPPNVFRVFAVHPVLVAIRLDPSQSVIVRLQK